MLNFGVLIYFVFYEEDRPISVCMTNRNQWLKLILNFLMAC